MKSIIFKALALPSTFLFAPFKLAIINIALFSVIFIFGTVYLQLNPIFAFIVLMIGHIVAITIGHKEPHIDTLILAASKRYPRTRNLIRVEGNKFLP
jgi:type IV secretory pathway VirB3-like protein